MNLKNLISVFLISFSVNLYSADVFTKAPGNWFDTNTWLNGMIPKQDDNVFIYHEVSYSSVEDLSLASLYIINQQGVNSSLTFSGSFSLNLSGHLIVNNLNTIGTTGLILLGDATLNINGDFYANKYFGDETNRSLKINLSNASMITCSNFEFDFNGMNVGELNQDFSLNNTASFLVQGNANFNNTGGDILNVNILDRANFTCLGNVTLQCQGGNQIGFTIDSGGAVYVSNDLLLSNFSVVGSDVSMLAKGILTVGNDVQINSSAALKYINLVVEGESAEFTIAKNINIIAKQEGDVGVSMLGASKLNLKGNINRPTGYGQLNMSDQSLFTFSGSSLQTIEETFGSDDFRFSNLVFNTADTITLTGDITVTNSATLTKGILKTTPTAKLILEEGASLIGGSAETYVNGPLTKIDPAPGTSFTFPIGDQGTYAPITLDILGGRGAGVKYTADYMSCAPPWGGEMANNLDGISNQEHWVLERSDKTQDINVHLHWTDADAQGISDLEDLVVAMYNPDVASYPEFPGGWTSIGNGGTTGGVGSGVSGAIMNIGTCPPPWGIQNFTFGVAAAATLPVEFESFNAELIGEVVDIDWIAEDQLDVDHYEVQKSLNGLDFEKLKEVSAKEIGRYSAKDLNPAEGYNYYRIKQYDLNGMIEYSTIQIVEYQVDANVIAFPNPIQDEVVLKGEFLKEVSNFRLSDINGKTLQIGTLDGRDAFQNLSIDELNIDQSGVYMLDLIGKTKSQSIRLVKQ